MLSIKSQLITKEKASTLLSHVVDEAGNRTKVGLNRFSKVTDFFPLNIVLNTFKLIKDNKITWRKSKKRQIITQYFFNSTKNFNKR